MIHSVMDVVARGSVFGNVATYKQKLQATCFKLDAAIQFKAHRETISRLHI